METNEIIITEITNGIAYYQELHDWAVELDCEPDDENFEALAIMEGDPDIIKCEGQDKLYFCTIKLGDKKFVLTSYEPTKEQIEMLRAFHVEDWRKHYSKTESTWKNFKQLTNAIAYRGGEGYVYTIWNYTPKIKS